MTVDKMREIFETVYLVELNPSRIHLLPGIVHPMSRNSLPQECFAEIRLGEFGKESGIVRLVLGIHQDPGPAKKVLCAATRVGQHQKADR